MEKSEDVFKVSIGFQISELCENDVHFLRSRHARVNGKNVSFEIETEESSDEILNHFLESNRRPKRLEIVNHAHDVTTFDSEFLVGAMLGVEHAVSVDVERIDYGNQPRCRLFIPPEQDIRLVKRPTRCIAVAGDRFVFR